MNSIQHSNNQHIDVKMTTKRPTILIVDDEPCVTAGLSRLLRDDADVIAANSGYEALAVFTTNDRIDLLLLDMTMPQYDSVELLEDMSERGFCPPVALFTGYRQDVMKTVADFASHLGFQMLSTLEKPVQKLDLLRVIDQVKPK